MSFYYCKAQPAKWPAQRRKAADRIPRRIRARLGTWPPTFLSWSKLSLALKRTRGPREVIVVAKEEP